MKGRWEQIMQIIIFKYTQHLVQHNLCWDESAFVALFYAGCWALFYKVEHITGDGTSVCERAWVAEPMIILM